MPLPAIVAVATKLGIEVTKYIIKKQGKKVLKEGAEKQLKKQVAKQTNKTSKKEVDSGLSIKKNSRSGKSKRSREKRDWSDVRLNDKKDGLAEKFLEEHGFNHSETGGKPNTYTYDGDKVKAYSEYVKDGKSGMSVKTFNNPTLKSLRNWMGY